MFSKNTFLLTLLSFVLLGCGLKTIKPSKEIILPPLAEVYQADKNEIFIGPAIINNSLPDYNPVELKLKKDIMVCVKIVITDEGNVSQIQPLKNTQNCSENISSEYKKLYALLEESIKNLGFLAAGVCHYQHDEKECEGGDADIQPITIKLAYRFLFSPKKNKILMVE